MNRLRILMAAGAAALLAGLAWQTARVQALRAELDGWRSGEVTGGRPAGAGIGGAPGTGSSEHSVPPGAVAEAGAGEADGSGALPEADGSQALTLAGVLGEPDPMRRMRSLLAYAERLRPGEFEPALEALRKAAPDWDPEAKLLAHVVLTRWAQVDPDAAFAALDRLEFARNESDGTSLLAGLAASDPSRAARWLSDPDHPLIAFPKMGHVLAGTVAKEWVRQDPDAALAWAQGRPDSQRVGALAGVFGALAAADPAHAARLADGLQGDDARRHVLGDIAAAWGRRSPREAMAWIESLDAPDDRNAAMGRALDAWAREAPAAAAAYLESAAGAEAAADKHVGAVAEAWSVRAPAEAASWIASRPESAGKGDAMGRVLWNWTNIDPQAASTWLAAQPDGPARDGGITGLAKAVFDSDPGAALSWAAEISDADLRAKATEIGLHEWIKRDPGAAESWIEANEPQAARRP